MMRVRYVRDDARATSVATHRKCALLRLSSVRGYRPTFGTASYA